MYYKIEKGTKLYDQLEKLTQRMQEVHEIAVKEVERCGGERYIPARGHIGGGIAAIELVNVTKPAGYKQAFKRHYDSMYCPNARNKELQQRWDDLPVVTSKELNDIVGFKEQMYTDQYGQDRYATTPSLNKRGDIYLVYVTLGIEYTPVEGMTEILVSEYQSIKGKDE